MNYIYEAVLFSYTESMVHLHDHSALKQTIDQAAAGNKILFPSYVNPA